MKKKSSIFAVMSKELARFFGDRRMVVTTILMPGILIYVIYTFMGGALADMFTTAEDYVHSVYAVNLPNSVSAMLAEADFDVTRISSSQEIEDAKTAVTDKELDLLLVFSEDFDGRVASYETSSGLPAPAAELYYNSTRTESSGAYSMVYSMLDTYESALANMFDVNPGGEGFDLASEKDSSGFMFSSMLPMLMMIFLFSGCMGVAPESIAGEKERGTIATMLITPMKRSELAIGKIFSLAIIALLAGASSALGTILSLPNLMGGTGEEVSALYYTVTDYLMLAAVVLSTVLLFISLISIISAYAKTIKEAATAVMPLMIIAMLVGVTAMFSGEPQGNIFYYLIPAYNSVQSMVGIFSFSADGTHILVTVLSNLAVSVICGFVLTKMFNSERCMFNK